MNRAAMAEAAFHDDKKEEAWRRKSPAGTWPPPPDRYERALLQVFEREPRGKVLDAPCGQGAMSVRLREMGFEVRCFDIAPELFRGEGFTVETGDMNVALPYPDGEFDYILSKNGAHRVFSLDRMIAEFARILRPGGRVVLSVPNYGRIQRRIRHLLYGSLSRNINSQECERVLDAPIANFRNCLLYPQIEKTFLRHGFQIRAITSDGKPYSQFHSLPLVWLVRFLCRFSSQKDREDYSLEGSNSAHALAGGGHLIVVAEKGA